MHKNLSILQKAILVAIALFCILAVFDFLNKIALQVIDLNSKGFDLIQIAKEVFLTIAATNFLTMIVALIALYFTLANYLRKDGNQVDATLGIEKDEKVIILVNKKDKPLIFNSINLLVYKDKYLVLSVKDKFKSFSDYEVVSPYSTLTFKLENSPLLDDLLLYQNELSIQIVLTTDEGLVVCNKLEALPIQVRSLRNPKNFKILDPNAKLDFE
ncbi:hypothetical protein HX005_11935 [Acinetobacter sp. R933-2]|nr:hypothetical protein [Acinetobacter sp. R933-2]